MTKAKSNYIKWAALCVVVAIVLTQSVRPSLATGTDDAFKKVKIDFETQTINKYCENLITFLKRVDELERRTSVSNAEVAEVTQTASALKKRAPEVAQSVESMIKKLKAAGLWSNLNTLIRTKIKNDRALSLLTQNGGINIWLESAVNEIRTNNDLFPDGSVRRLNLKVKSQQSHSFTDRETQASSFNVVKVGFNPATPSTKRGFFACVVLVIFLFSKAINGDVTENDVNQVTDQCS
jgi:hypothetical protein